MANKIVLKKSSVASKVPLVSDLEYGEVALNYQDGKLYYKSALNAIAAFSAVPTYAGIISGLGYTPINKTGDTLTGSVAINTTETSAATPILSLNQTWNNAATQFNALNLDITDTASNANSSLVDFKVSGSSKLTVTKTGNLYTSGILGIGTPASYSGFSRNGNNLLLMTSSQAKVNISTGAGATFFNNIAFGSDIYAADLYLYREAANTLALRNTTTAQTFRVYNTYTDASNYERAVFRWNTNVLDIGTEASGTGVRRQINLNYTTTIDGNARTNVPALTLTNLGAGAGGLKVGVMEIGYSQDNARMTAFYIPNKGIRYAHAGAAIASQGAHRFSGDNNTGTSSGALGSIVDILAPSTATNIFQCRQADETNVFNVDYSGKVTHNGIVPTDGNNIDQIKTITKSLTLTTDWQDTGIKSTDISTGTYILQLIANDTGSGGTNNNEYYSGTMSWYSGDTNSALELPTDEIPLHRAGGSGDGALYLRTYRTATADPDNLKLQIYSNTANASAANYVFKFRRII